MRSIHLTTVLLSKPDILEEWRKATQTVIRGIAKAEELSLEEKVHKVAKTRDVSFGALRKALWNMHQISLKLFAPPAAIRNMGNDQYLKVSKDGVINVLSEDEPIKHPGITVKSI